MNMNTATDSTVPMNPIVPVGRVIQLVDLGTACRRAMDSFEYMRRGRDASHVAMMDVLTACSLMDPKSIKESVELQVLFSQDFKGLERRRLVAWVETYSPVRIRFETSGKFKDVAWSSTHVKNCKAGNSPVFDLVGARANPWYHMEEASKGVSFKSASANSLANTLIRAAAKAAVMESEGDNGFDMVVFQTILDDAIDCIRKNGAIDGLKYACSDNFAAWEISAIEHKKSIRRQQAQANADVLAARKAKLDMLSKAIDGTTARNDNSAAI
jgi:hypothetical protein